MASRKTTKRTTMREIGRKGGREVQRQRDMRDRKEVRGRAYDKPGPAKGTAFGVAAITQALVGLDFPASKDDVLQRAGDQRVHYRKDQEISLRQVIEDSDEEEFPSMSQVIQAVSGALRREGVSKPRGGGSTRGSRAGSGGRATRSRRGRASA